jgi:hypothetical protein
LDFAEAVNIFLRGRISLETKQNNNKQNDERRKKEKENETSKKQT